MTTPPRHQRIAAYIRGLMAVQQVTRRQAAAALSMPEQTFGRKINGKNPFTIDELDQLIRFLGLSWEDVANATEPGKSVM